jgi:hypothetical protein
MKSEVYNMVFQIMTLRKLGKLALVVTLQAYIWEMPGSDLGSIQTIVI